MDSVRGTIGAFACFKSAVVAGAAEDQIGENIARNHEEDRGSDGLHCACDD